MTQIGDDHLTHGTVVIGERLVRRSRIRGWLYSRETPFNSIRRHAELGVRSISFINPFDAVGML